MTARDDFDSLLSKSNEELRAIEQATNTKILELPPQAGVDAIDEVNAVHPLIWPFSLLRPRAVIKAVIEGETYYARVWTRHGYVSRLQGILDKHRKHKSKRER